ncbi:MAG: trypsin-like peptidase domain-containing protein [Phycisphaerales bacterium]
MHRSRITGLSLLVVLAGSAAFYGSPTIAALGESGQTVPTVALAEGESVTRTTAAEPDATQKRAMDMAFNLSEAFSYAAEKIEPSVVHITTRDSNRTVPGQAGLGSGVVVDERGYILTNNHVVASGRYISARLADGRELPAEVVGTFEETDIAVLKVEADDLVAAEFADSEAMRVGQWVLAVGSPFGFDQSVTAGIVSAKGRGSIGPGADMGGLRLQEFIQTDAAINPGNSGGPLVDLYGNIAGINTAIISRTGAYNGLGFAIPSDIAQAVMEQIIETGRVKRGWLGISMRALDANDAHRLGIEGGVIVREALAEGPAEEAGLKAGDIIVSIGGRTTENIVRLSNAIMITRPNEPVKIEYIRDGERRSVSAVVSNRDEEIVLARVQAEVKAREGAYLEEIGVGIVPGVLQLNNRRMLRRLPGYLVEHVDGNSPASLRGLREDDFIYEVDGREFDTAAEIESYIRTAGTNGPVRISFLREAKPMFIDVTPGG